MIFQKRLTIIICLSFMFAVFGMAFAAAATYGDSYHHFEGLKHKSHRGNSHHVSSYDGHHGFSRDRSDSNYRKSNSRDRHYKTVRYTYVRPYSYYNYLPVHYGYNYHYGYGCNKKYLSEGYYGKYCNNDYYLSRYW